MSPRAAASRRLGGEVGRPVDLDLTGAWLVDPWAGRSGVADVVVRSGTIESIEWTGAASDDDGWADRVVVTPGFTDLHVHLREPGNSAAETIATGIAAAAHGGFTTVCAMPNTSPPLDGRGAKARFDAAVAAAGSPVRALAYGAASAGRAGEQLASVGDLAAAGVVGFSDDGSPIRSPALLRNLLAYAGMVGLPVVDHAEDPILSDGAEANEGVPATILGLKGWPGAAEASVVARDVAILADVLRDVPTARLHLTHLSTAASLELVRRAKVDGLPVTCDVTPHHLALTDDWLLGHRTFAWQPLRAAPTGPRFDTALKVNPPLRSREDAAACVAALVDGTADAIATDHAPHGEVDKAVEFGLAANGVSGLETALGVVLELVAAARLSLPRAVEALTKGPDSVLGATAPRAGFAVGAPADLVVFDPAARWTVTEAALASRGKNTPLLGRSLRGEVLLTVAGGRLAYEAPPA